MNDLMNAKIGRYIVQHSATNSEDLIFIKYKTHVRKIRKWDSDYEEIVRMFKEFEQNVDDLFRHRQ